MGKSPGWVVCGRSVHGEREIWLMKILRHQKVLGFLGGRFGALEGAKATLDPVGWELPAPCFAVILKPGL